jgi:hypothetical protein
MLWLLHVHRRSRPSILQAPTGLGDQEISRYLLLEFESPLVPCFSALIWRGCTRPSLTHKRCRPKAGHLRSKGNPLESATYMCHLNEPIGFKMLQSLLLRPRYDLIITAVRLLVILGKN